LRARRVQALYFEYAEKHLIRISKPGNMIAFLDSAGFTTYFCHVCDYALFPLATIHALNEADRV